MAKNTAMQAVDQNAAGSQHMPDDSSSSLRRASSSAISLLFSLDDASEKLGYPAPDSIHEYDPILEVQRIKQACVLTASEQKLSHAVSEAKASSILTTGSVQLSHVGSYLRSKYGYLVVVRNANIAKRLRSYLRMLRHKYLVCRGLEGMEGVDVLVDLNFKDHFILPHSTSWYSKLVSALPQDWIGTAAALAPLVGLMSAGMRLCFKQAGVPLPPWREGRALLSKWVPEVFEDVPLPMVPLPDPALRRILAPYHAPFRVALRTATVEPASRPSARMEISSDARQATQQQAQQQPGSHGKPPLPRTPSGVALATASVKAAAAGAAGALLAAPASHTAAAGSSHSGHMSVGPDVPRKIIVGFPDQNFLPAAAVGRHPTSSATPMGTADIDIGSGTHADAGAYVIRQQTDSSGALRDKQQQHEVLYPAVVRPATVGSAITSMLAQQGMVGRGRNVGGHQPLSQQAAGASRDKQGAAPEPAAYTLLAAKAAVKQQLQTQPKIQPQQQLHEAHGRPAFSSAVGVVTANCGNSPAIVINQQLLQQLQPPAAGTGAGLDSAAAAAGEHRQFKALDQLLPRMRTVRLGAA